MMTKLQAWAVWLLANASGTELEARANEVLELIGANQQLQAALVELDDKYEATLVRVENLERQVSEQERERLTPAAIPLHVSPPESPATNAWLA